MAKKKIKPKAKQWHATGKRKTAVARATLKEGKGKIKINNMLLDVFSTEFARDKINEALAFSKNLDKFDLDITVRGGGPNSQAEAVRLAVAKALSIQEPKLKAELLDYDRQFLVADIRRKEVRKPNTRGKARSKRQKSYR